MLKEEKLRLLIRKQILNELKFNTGWIKKSIRTAMPVFGFDPYMIWNRSYNDSYTKRRLEAIENVFEAFKQLWENEFNEQPDMDLAEKVYQYTAKRWRTAWTAADKDEEKAKENMLKRLNKLYILPEKNRRSLSNSNS